MVQDEVLALLQQLSLFYLGAKTNGHFEKEKGNTEAALTSPGGRPLA